MAKRIVSTVLLWSIVIGSTFFGTVGGVWLLTIVSFFTLREFYAMLERMGIDPFDRFGSTLGIAITLAPYYFGSFLGPAELLALTVIVFSVRILGEREPHNRVETLAWSLFGVVYVPFMLQFLVRMIIIETPHARTGLLMAIWLIAVSKFCDVGALLTGMAIGRTKMAPNISPKKTWEGAAGGLVFSGLIGAGIAYWGRAYFPPNFTPLLAGLCALPIAALGVVSDLIESIIKRRANSKDAGKTIPGIGGVFDLSDSLILTSPIGYALFHFLQR